MPCLLPRRGGLEARTAMAELSWVIQEPGSRGNPGPGYRVTEAGDLSRYLCGAARSYAYVPRDTLEEAEELRDKLNRDSRR
jgi:hypothetical protein